MTAPAGQTGATAWWLAVGRGGRCFVCLAAGLLLVLAGGLTGYFGGGTARLRAACKYYYEVQARRERADAEYGAACSNVCAGIKREIGATEAEIARLREERENLRKRDQELKAQKELEERKIRLAQEEVVKELESERQALLDALQKAIDARTGRARP